MKTFAIVASLLSLSTAAVATVSKPFYLNVQSKNATINNKRFGTCHEGAGIESLCLYPGDTATFKLNTTNGLTTGSLFYELVVNGGAQKVPSALQFEPSLLSTNVLHLQFVPDYQGGQFGFDASNRLYAPVSYDDSVTPPTVSSKPTKFYNFFVCEVNSAGYVYNSLNWVVGRGNVVPTNPSCQKVDVLRKFA